MATRTKLESDTIAKYRKTAKQWGISADDAEKKARRLLPLNSDKDLQEFLKKPLKKLSVNALDPGHEAADKELKKAEKEVTGIMVLAASSMQKKLGMYLRQYADADARMLQKMQSGEITEAEYKAWRQQTLLQSKEWPRLRDELAAEASGANDDAKDAIHSRMADVYAENYNYGAYEIEMQTGIDTDYSLQTGQTVRNAMKTNKKLYASPANSSAKAKAKAKHKDLKWNRDHVYGELFQGIMQGESFSKMAARMFVVAEMNRSALMRYARTMTTNAESVGRLDAYTRANGLGIEVMKTWSATLDERTRESHRRLNGETVRLDERFSNGLRYPGDPFGSAAETANCRCTLIPQINEALMVFRDSGLLAGMSYKQWKEKHSKKGLEDDGGSNIMKMDLQYFAGGKKRADKYSANWSEESLESAIERFVGENPTSETTETGKTIYSSVGSDFSIVYDDEGKYFRISDNRKTGKRQYVDINGNDVSNVIENGKQSGRPKDEYESMTHFKIRRDEKK